MLEVIPCKTESISKHTKMGIHKVYLESNEWYSLYIYVYTVYLCVHEVYIRKYIMGKNKNVSVKNDFLVSLKS